MLTVTFTRDSRRRLSRVLASGHAEAGPYGEDLVCAAASAILQAAWLGLAEHVGLAVSAEKAEGRLDLCWPAESRDRDDVRAIVGTARLAVGALAQQFPGHVRCVDADEP